MSKNQKALAVLGVFLFLIVISNLGHKIKSNDIKSYTNKITAKEYLEKMKDEELQVFYVGSTSCGYCTQFAPTLIDVIEEYGIKVNYINIVDETNEGISSIEKSSEKLKGFGTPTMVITKNNEVIDTKIGATSKDVLIKFLVDNNVMKAPITSKDELKDYTNNSNIEEYLTLKKEDKLNIFYLGSTTCGYCTEFAPTLIKVIKDYELEVNYINLVEEIPADISVLESSSEKLKGFGTPTMVVTKNDEVIEVNIGLMKEAALIEFFKKSNIIK